MVGLGLVRFGRAWYGMVNKKGVKNDSPKEICNKLKRNESVDS